MAHKDTTRNDMLAFLDNFETVWDAAMDRGYSFGELDRLSDMLGSYCRCAGLPDDMSADELAAEIRARTADSVIAATEESEPLDFDTWREGRKFHSDITAYVETGSDSSGPGFVYPGGLYVELLDGRNDCFYLAIENTQYCSADLTTCEMRLYDYALSSGNLDGLRAVKPDYMSEDHTGGGCTAWRMDIGGPNDPFVWVTDCDASSPTRKDEPCGVGLYDREGQQIMYWDFDTLKPALEICEGLRSGKAI